MLDDGFVGIIEGSCGRRLFVVVKGVVPSLV